MQTNYQAIGSAFPFVIAQKYYDTLGNDINNVTAFKSDAYEFWSKQIHQFNIPEAIGVFIDLMTALAEHIPDDLLDYPTKEFDLAFVPGNSTMH